MSRLLIYVELAGDESAAFTDAFNEWARHPDIDVLMARTTDTPSGDPESDYSFVHPASTNCPTCGSPAPHRHPAVQFEGEVQPCRDPFHLTVTPENTPERIAEMQETIARIYPERSLHELLKERADARADSDGWIDRGEWENVPADVIQRTLKADRAVLAWLDAHPDALDDAYRVGYLDGVAAYAYSSGERWAENGVQYVGTTGRTLAEATARVEETFNYSPPSRR